MAAPRAVSVRNDLTQYAHGVLQDADAARAVAQLLAPTVPTGATSGAYNKFDDTQAFKAYAAAVARRSVGSQAREIGFLSTTANYNADPYGLRISIDNHERDQANNNMALLEQAKTRTLTINCMVAHLNDVVTKIKAAVSAESDKGDWRNANVDPIAEIDQVIKAVWLATGMAPNHVTMDFGAWCELRGNKQVRAYFPGKQQLKLGPNDIQGLFVNPNAKLTIVDSAVLTGGGLGNASATMQGVMGGSVFVHYSSPVPTVYDPSFAKTFAPSQQLFTEVYSYREEPHLDWYENDWTADVEVVAAGLCKRIDVSQANEA